MQIVGRRARWIIALPGAMVTLAASPVAGRAQPDARQALVNVSVSPAIVTIGQPFTVRIRVRAPKVATITFPDVPPAAGGVDPIDPRSVEDGPPGDVLDRTAVYTFAAWDLGRRAPALGPVVVSVAGQERSIAIGDASVMVRSMLPADSSALVPRELRAPVPLPTGRWRYAVLGTLLAAGMAWYWWRRRRRRLENGVESAPEAWEQAKASFATLETLALAEVGEPGRNVIAHVDVLRTYLARRFPAVDASLDAPRVPAALAEAASSVPIARVAALLERDTALRFAHAPVGVTESDELAAEARDITAQIQVSHEARLRALERPPRPRRR